MDSYPTPGGTAFAEQLVSGRRCVGLRAPIQGYSPADNLKSKNVDDLMTSILQCDNDPAVIESVYAVNGYDAVKARYLACLYDDVLCANEMEHYVAWSGMLLPMNRQGKLPQLFPSGNCKVDKFR